MGSSATNLFINYTSILTYLFISLFIVSFATNSYQEDKPFTCFGLQGSSACLTPTYGLCQGDNYCYFNINGANGITSSNSFYFGNNLKGQLDAKTAGSYDYRLPQSAPRPNFSNFIVDLKIFNNFTLFVDFNGVMYGLGDVYNSGNIKPISSMIETDGPINVVGAQMNVDFNPLPGLDERKKGIRILGDDYSNGMITVFNELYVKGENNYNNLGLNNFTAGEILDFTGYNNTDLNSNHNVIMDVNLNRYSSCKIIYNTFNESFAIETSGLINYSLQNKPLGTALDNSILQNTLFNHTILYKNGVFDVDTCHVTKYNLFLLKKSGSLLVFSFNNFIYEVTLPNNELITEFKCLSLNDNNDEIVLTNDVEKLLANTICVLKSNMENIYLLGNVTNHPCSSNIYNYYKPILIYKNNLSNTINQFEISKLNILFTIQQSGFLFGCGKYNNTQFINEHEIFKNFTFSNKITVNNIDNNNLDYDNNIYKNNQKYSEIALSFNRIAIPNQFNKIWRFSVSTQGDSMFMVPYSAGTCSDDYIFDQIGRGCVPKFTCFGIQANVSTEVCTNGHGSCSLPNFCKCNSNYYGKQCELTTCFGIWNNDKKVCSNGNGVCSAYNTCQCKEGYGGSQCENEIEFKRKLAGQSIVFGDTNEPKPTNYLFKMGLQMTSSIEEYNNFMTNIHNNSVTLSLKYNLFMAGKKYKQGTNTQSSVLEYAQYEVFNNGSYSFDYQSPTSIWGVSNILYYTYGPMFTYFSPVTKSGRIYATGTVTVETPKTEGENYEYCGNTIPLPTYTTITGTITIAIVARFNVNSKECEWATLLYENDNYVQIPYTLAVREAESTSGVNKDIVIVSLSKIDTLYSTTILGRILMFEVDNENFASNSLYDKLLKGETDNTLYHCEFYDLQFVNNYTLYIVGSFSGAQLVDNSTNTVFLNHLLSEPHNRNNTQMILFKFDLTNTNNILLYSKLALNRFGIPVKLFINQLTNEYYIAGSLSSKYSFGMPSNYGMSSFVNDAYIGKYNLQNDNLIWEINFGPTAYYSAVIKDLYFDKRSGGLYVTGQHTGAFTYEGINFPLSISPRNVFIMQLDPVANGKVLWSSSLSNYGGVISTSIVMDAYGNLIFGGVITNSNLNVDNNIIFRDSELSNDNTFLLFYDMTCVSGRFGEFCKDFNCYGINKEDTNVCKGKGTCKGPNNCKCIANYAGIDCSQYSCFGKHFEDWNVACSGKGKCIAYNLCKCNDGYYGKNCEYVKCFGNESDNIANQNINGGKVLPSVANVLCQRLNRMR
ncbi:hypothetical protein ABK040_016510 [Willaertia magna]